MIYLILILIICFLVLLFGPYTIHLHGEKNGEIYCIECQIYTWQDILGYQYIRKKNHVQHVLLFSEKKVVSILREKKSEESKPFNLQNRERTEKRKRITYFIDLFQIMGDTIVRLIRYLFHLIHFEKLRIIGIFGFKNPATTGMIYGWSQSLYYLKNKYVEIHLNPDFINVRIEGRFDMRFHFILFSLLGCIIDSSFRLFVKYRTFKKMQKGFTVC